MTKTSVKKLNKGQEVFNTNTGEVAYFTSIIGMVGETFFIGSVDYNGRAYIWPHNMMDRV